MHGIYEVRSRYYVYYCVYYFLLREATRIPTEPIDVFNMVCGKIGQAKDDMESTVLKAPLPAVHPTFTSISSLWLYEINQLVREWMT